MFCKLIVNFSKFGLLNACFHSKAVFLIIISRVAEEESYGIAFLGYKAVYR